MTTSADQLQAWMIGGLDGRADDHAALLRALVPLLRAFYRRRVRGDGDDIEDLVQETLIAVHTRRATYDRDRPFSAWLFAIARYKMIDHFRRVRRLVPMDGLEDTLLAEDFAAAVDARMDLSDLLKTLPPKQAAVIQATRVEGRSIAETAEAAGLGESDVKISVHRGLKALFARVQGGRS
ncbi:sigma-70 family RNA polymerase sigma factor [Caulobacter mirabilis]|uniref:RNA polymerase subunit sigma-70 n=1 Tax=Caulobacter mirabilis TaxID=69666 RepID=A0A2D2B317_9CAUL|nr:sigma-70 family RNA polymerase sigma factor [Caulobacter mirabilis]ATQ44616.1 RNA polymerase subunit sigma-70 [Caulobacter mirabilis]